MRRRGRWRACEARLLVHHLFPGKGKAPLLITQLDLLPDMAARVGDVDGLVELCGGEFKSRYAWQSAHFTTPLTDALVAPIIFINGFRPFEPTEREITYLRALLDNGAVLWVNACNKVFDDSFRAQLARILPGARLEPLDADHPLYSAHKPIPNPADKFLEGVSWQCRMPVIYSGRDLSYGWATGLARDGVEGDTARAIGLNVVRYCIGRGDQLDRLRKVDPVKRGGEFREDDRPPVAPGAFIPAQLTHEGDSDPDPDVMIQVLDDLRTQLPINTGHNARPIGIDDPALFNHPFLVLKGHRTFALAPAATERLGRYLTAGGFLYVECCCAAPEFDRAARALFAAMFPDKPLASLPAEHAIFTLGGKPMRPVEFTAKADRAASLPPLEGIEHEGRTIAVYLPMAAGCAINGHPRASCCGIKDRDDALELYRRLVQYAMTR